MHCRPRPSANLESVRTKATLSTRLHDRAGWKRGGLLSGSTQGKRTPAEWCELNVSGLKVVNSPEPNITSAIESVIDLEKTDLRYCAWHYGVDTLE